MIMQAPTGAPKLILRKAHSILKMGIFLKINCSHEDRGRGGASRDYSTLDEWPGNTCAFGSMTTAALLMAVAASPKPTEMSFTLPS
jgi:hypothetical protein